MKWNIQYRTEKISKNISYYNKVDYSKKKI